MTDHSSDCPCDDCWQQRRTRILAYRANPDRRHERGSYGPKHRSEYDRQRRQETT